VNKPAPRRNRRKPSTGALPRRAALSAVVVVAALLAWLPGYRLDLAVGDRLVGSSQHSPAGDDRIVVVGLDEATLASLAYRSPIDRGLLTSIVAKLDKAGAEAIGVDILIDQATEPDKDLRLRQQLIDAKSRVVMAYATRDLALTPAQSSFLDDFVKGLQPGLVELVKDDLDGRVRWYTRGKWVDGNWVPGFAAALAGHLTPPNTGKPLISRFLPAKAGAGRPFAFPVYPAQSLSLLPDQWFKDKYVLIGAVLPHEDRHRAPFAGAAGSYSAMMPGVLIHAHLLAHILSGKEVREGTLISGLAAAFGAAISAAAIMLIGLGPWQRLALVTGLIGMAGLTTAAIFNAFLIILPLATVFLGAILSSGGVSLVQWAQDRHRRRFVEAAFARYVGAQVAQEIAAHPESLKLGGERRTVTVVFTDLEGFTSLSETLPPEQLVKLLNAYLDGICDAFIESGATIDKVVGDAVVGFFGAPEEQPDQAARAADLAIAIDIFSERFRADAREQGIALGVTRVGIHKGEAIIGNFGGERFFDYTGIGDTVNTAARLEAANRHFGTRVCVSEAVANACPGHRFRPIGSVRLKGKSRPLNCLELTTVTDGLPQSGEMYSAAFSLIQTEPEVALARFEALRQEYPADGLIAFQVRRLRNGAPGQVIDIETK
jgi:adenylate cyclase